MSSRAKAGSADFEGPRKTTKYRVDSISGAKVIIEPMGSSIAPMEFPTEIFPITPRKGHIVKLSIEIEDPHTRAEWAKAFASQGKSDLDIYEILSDPQKLKDPDMKLPSCHRLHYLQMATEKIAKAYQVARDSSWSPRKKSHVAAVEFVRNYYNSPSMRARYDRNREQLAIIRDNMVKIAREIEQLAPAIDDDNVPANVEYPWEHRETLVIPCEHRFPVEDEPAAQVRQFVQMLKDVAAEKLGT